MVNYLLLLEYSQHFNDQLLFETLASNYLLHEEYKDRRQLFLRYHIMKNTSLFEEKDKKKHITTFARDKFPIQHNSYIFLDFIAMMLDFISVDVDSKAWEVIGNNLRKLETENNNEDHTLALYSRDKKGGLTTLYLKRNSEQQFDVKHLKTRKMKIPELITSKLLESKHYSRPYHIHYISLTSQNLGNYHVAIRINALDHHIKIYLTRSDMREYKYIEQTLLSVLHYIVPWNTESYFKTRGDE